ncbi:hypothetical protein [Hyalangium sp.]|uniref:hypothetical protein n=1 Tax=Hyalangium sp. TaxID=2028555 RepID=UPI002D27C691|nr:hypothetical protein [Hyalangium sp.]HYH97622.1 hypothetical protein [Hyalangium sp.]
MTPEPRRVTDAMLERYLADVLDAEAKARIEAVLARSPELQARVAELRADSGAFFVRHPPGPLVARYREERRRAQWWRPVLLVPALAAAALVLVLLPPIEDPEGPYTAKGPVLLVLHRKVGESSRPVSPDVPLVPHDVLRFEVKASTSGFAAVLGRDARGTVTVYHPFGGEAGAPYDATQPLLPGAIELDDTLGREDLYVLHSTQAFDVTWAVQALQQNRRLQEAAPDGISVGHVSLVKEAPP